MICSGQVVDLKRLDIHQFYVPLVDEFSQSLKEDFVRENKEIPQ